MASWSTRRQLTYFFGFFVVLILMASLAAFYFWPRATCDDGRRNQDELGTDCGGGCLAVCPNEAIPIRAAWARVLPLGAEAYDLAAFVSNPNVDLRAVRLPYEIKFVDDKNVLINGVRGEVSLWPGEALPIFAPDINVGRRVPARAYLELTGSARFERSTSTSPAITVTEDNFTATPAPLLNARLTNNSLKPVAQIEVAVLLSDAEHNAFAVNSTFVEQLGPNETKEISFNWPRPFALTPTFTEFYPHVATPSAL
ncbi:MAG: hypothetical protein AAB415_00910 [Patescibacteria group bacterium]